MIAKLLAKPSLNLLDFSHICYDVARAGEQISCLLPHLWLFYHLHIVTNTSSPTPWHNSDSPLSHVVPLPASFSIFPFPSF